MNYWGFRKSGRISINDAQHVQRLWVLFYDMGLNDKEIIRFLVKESYTISLPMSVQALYQIPIFLHSISAIGTIFESTRRAAYVGQTGMDYSGKRPSSYRYQSSN